MLSPTRSFVDSLVDLLRIGQYGTRHLYASLSDIDKAGRGAFMRHQIDAEAFLGWYIDSPSGYPDSDDDDSNTMTTMQECAVMPGTP